MVIYNVTRQNNIVFVCMFLHIVFSALSIHRGGDMSYPVAGKCLGYAKVHSGNVRHPMQ